MKKLSLFLAFSFVFLLSITAQENSDGKNWFFGIGPKGNWYLDDKNAMGNYDIAKQASLAGDVFLGKWFSQKVGARLFVDYGSIHSFYNGSAIMVDQNYLGGRLDLMFNLTNLFRPYSSDRFYNMIPYIGAGAIHTFDSKSVTGKAFTNVSSTTLVAGGGLLNTFRLSNHVSLFLDVALHGANIENRNDDNSKEGWGKDLERLASGSVGLVFNFGKAAKKEIVPPPVVKEQPAPAPAPKPEPKPQPKPQPEPKPQPKPEPPKVVEQVQPALEDVFFRLDKSVIDPDQEYKIKQAADFLKANPNATLNVKGFADVQTGNPKYNLALSRRRVDTVVGELVNKYGVSKNRLNIDYKGDSVQPYKENDKNRVVLLRK